MDTLKTLGKLIMSLSIGWSILIPVLIVGLIWQGIRNAATNPVFGIFGIVLGLALLVAFSLRIRLFFIEERSRTRKKVT
jgi:hypothetical protein